MVLVIELKQGKKLVLTLGYSHPVEIVDPEGITIEVPAPNKIIVKGMQTKKKLDSTQQISELEKT